MQLDETIWPQLSKIISKQQAAELLSSLKEHGKKIGFTNGCFDLMLAKKECDILIVGINTDASVRRYKGPTRPIQDEQTRSIIVASLPFVDYVVLFDDDTAEPLIDAFKPDVIAKEGYSIDKWPEAQKVISYGGRAVTLPRLEGYSTSDQVAKMKV